MDDEARRLILERARAGLPDRAQRRERRRKASRHSFGSDQSAENGPSVPIPVKGPTLGDAATRAPPPALPTPDLAEATAAKAPKRAAQAAQALPAPLMLPDLDRPVDPLRAALETLRQTGLRLPAATTAPQAFWNEGLLALHAWKQATGRPLPGRSERFAGQHLGRWVQVQQEHRERLSPAQQALLDAVEGWTWG